MTTTFHYMIHWQAMRYRPEDYMEISAFFMVGMTNEYINMHKKAEKETGFVKWTINLN